MQIPAPRVNVGHNPHLHALHHRLVQDIDYLSNRALFHVVGKNNRLRVFPF
jgi:hypothetical protein